MHPDKTLASGVYANYHDENIKITVTKEDLALFSDFKVSATSEADAVVLLAMNDDVIDANATYDELNDVHRIICYEHGGHRFNQLSEMKDIIEGVLTKFTPSGLTN